MVVNTTQVPFATVGASGHRSAGHWITVSRWGGNVPCGTLVGVTNDIFPTGGLLCHKRAWWVQLC